MLGRLASIPHPCLHQSRCCSVRIPKIVYQPRVHQRATAGGEGGHAQHSSPPEAPIGKGTYPASEKATNSSGTPSGIPKLVCKPRTIGLSSSNVGMNTSSKPHDRERTEYATLDHAATVPASLHRSSPPVAQAHAPANHQLGSLLTAGGISTQAVGMGKGKHLPNHQLGSLLTAGGISTQAVGMGKGKHLPNHQLGSLLTAGGIATQAVRKNQGKHLPKADTERLPGGQASFMYRINKAKDRTAIMSNFVSACSSHANNGEMLDLTLQRLRYVQSTTDLWKNPAFDQFCDALASDGVLNTVPPHAHHNVCHSLLKLGALCHPHLVTGLSKVVLRHLSSVGQRSLCRFLAVFSDPNTGLRPADRTRALRAVANEVQLRTGVFSLSDGGRDYAAVVKFLIAPCVLTDAAFLRDFLGLLLRSSDMLRAGETGALVEALHAVATAYSDQALAIVAAALARRTASEEWRPALDALRACGVAVPSVAIETETLRSATEPGQLVRLLVEPRSPPLSVADARHVLAAMRPHLRDVGADDVARVRAFLAAAPDRACLYDVLAAVFLESVDAVAPAAALAFLALFSDCAEFPAVVAAGRVHFVAAMESLSDGASLAQFDVFCRAGLWNAAVVRHACDAVARSEVSPSSDDGERFIANMAAIRCTDAALMEKLVAEYVLPRAASSKKVSASLLRSLATLNVPAAQELFDRFESGDIELSLPAGTRMTAELALSLLVACQLYDVYPRYLVEFFVSRLTDTSSALDACGAADLGDAVSVVLGLQHQDKIAVDLSAAAFEKLARFYPSFEKEFTQYMAEPNREVSLIRQVLRSYLTAEAFVNTDSFSRCGDFFAAALLYDQNGMKFLPCQHLGVLNPTSLLERNTTSVPSIRHVAVIVDGAGAVARNSSHMLGSQALLHRRLERLGWSVIRVKAWQCVGEFQARQVMSLLLSKFISDSYRHGAMADTLHVEHDAQRQQPLAPTSTSQNDCLRQPSLDGIMTGRDLRIATKTVKEARFVYLTKHLLQLSLKTR